MTHGSVSDMSIAPRALAALECSGGEDPTAGLDQIVVSDLLRGLITQDGSVAARALSADALTNQLLDIANATFISHSRRTWIDYAAEESARRGQTYVGTEHLLLAALRELQVNNPHCADTVRSLRGQTWRTLIDMSQGSLRIPAGPKTPLDALEPATESLLSPVISDEPVVGASFATISRDNVSNALVTGWADLAANRPVRPDTRFRVGSITKIATTLLVLRLLDDGALHLDQPANEHLQSLILRDRHGTTSTTTIRQLLTHTAGLPRGSGLRHHDGPVPPIPRAFPDGIQAEDDVGTWSYSNLGFVVLAQVTADLLHTSFARAIHERVLTPLGLRESVLAPDIPDRTPYPQATGYTYDRHSFIPLRDIGVVAQGAGDLVATASDTAKLIAATIHDGYLSAKTRAELAVPHASCGDRTWQGLGVRIRQRGRFRLIGHDGSRPGFESSALACKESGRSAALLTNTDTRPLSPYLEELLLADSS